MAKVQSILKFKGSIDHLSFYTLNGEQIVRRKGGFNGKRIKHEARYKRTRENASEFGHCSFLSKALRLALITILPKKAYKGVHQRVVPLLFKIKNLDLVHGRGERTVAEGMTRSEAIDLFTGFEFNAACGLNNLLATSYLFDSGHFTITHFNCERDVVFPKGATHVGITLGACLFDFVLGKGEMVAMDAVVLAKTDTASTVDLRVVSTGSSGTLLWVISVCFYEMVHGTLYAFKAQNGSCVRVMGIADSM